MAFEETPDNPFASPQTFDDQPQVVDSEVEAVRKRLLSHEASIKSMGLLFFIGAVFGILGGVGYTVGAVAALAQGGAGPEGPILLGLGALVLAIGVLQFWVARGLRRLDQKVRTPAIILSALGLLWIPIGTLINGYFLYLLLSEKGKQVMSPPYQEIIAATPHIKYKTSIIVWIFLGLLVLFIVLAIFAAIVGATP